MILTYNRSELFEKTFRSVCNQTYNDLTIKVFNNGSIDNTEDVFFKVKNEYSNRKIEYLKLEENHLDDYYLEKRNEILTADYCIIFHDDDLMHPRYVEYLMKVINEHPEVVLLGGKTNISSHLENIPWCEPEGKYILGNTCDLTKWYIRGDTFSFPSICYKTEILKKLKSREDLYGNRLDFPFVAEVSKYGPICELKDRFIHYRTHGNNDFYNLPTMEQRINLINKFASILLAGDNECREIFYDRIYRECSDFRFIDYKTAKEHGWISKKTDKKLKREFSFPYLYFKYILYGIIANIVYKFSKNQKLRKKYAKKHLKYRNKIKKAEKYYTLYQK